MFQLSGTGNLVAWRPTPAGESAASAQVSRYLSQRLVQIIHASFWSSATSATDDA